MAKDLYEKRTVEFKEFVKREHRLPRAWEVRFSDNEDMRLWFNKLSRVQFYQGFFTEIDNLLSNYDLKILSDREKEFEFITYINSHSQIPLYGEAYFSDNDEMRSWYISYKEKNRDFETIIHNSLKEYQELDIEAIWSFVKVEFISIIKKL